MLANLVINKTVRQGGLEGKSLDEGKARRTDLGETITVSLELRIRHKDIGDEKAETG